MDLHHTFEIPAGLDHAWAVLMDIPRIAPCMPGAELSEVVNENTYKGAARVKVGPVQLRFTGQAEILDIDNAAHSATVRARGSDAKGRGNADADVRFALRAAGESRTAVDVSTRLNLTGSVAQYGRASGLIDEIAKQIIADFVRNLEAELARDAPAPAPAFPGRQAPVQQPRPAPGGGAISGISLLLRALLAMVKRWLGLSKT